MNETLFPEMDNIKPILLMDQLIGFSQKKLIPKKEAEAIWGKKAVKRGITNETQSIVKEFVDEINKERDPKHFKPVTGKQIAVKLLTVFKTNHELYEFLSECRDYKNRNGSFSKRFWGGFKSKPLT